MSTEKRIERERKRKEEEEVETLLMSQHVSDVTTERKGRRRGYHVVLTR